jgi:hypothetical protein
MKHDSLLKAFCISICTCIYVDTRGTRPTYCQKYGVAFCALRLQPICTHIHRKSQHGHTWHMRGYDHYERVSVEICLLNCVNECLPLSMIFIKTSKCECMHACFARVSHAISLSVVHTIARGLGTQIHGQAAHFLHVHAGIWCAIFNRNVTFFVFSKNTVHTTKQEKLCAYLRQAQEDTEPMRQGALVRDLVVQEMAQDVGVYVCRCVANAYQIWEKRLRQRRC